MSDVRAKFIVRAKEASIYAGQELTTVKLDPVYSPDPKSENGKFWNFTPMGKIELGTINKAAADAFELGKEYYIDFTRAE